MAVSNLTVVVLTYSGNVKLEWDNDAIAASSGIGCESEGWLRKWIIERKPEGGSYAVVAEFSHGIDLNHKAYYLDTSPPTTDGVYYYRVTVEDYGYENLGSELEPFCEQYLDKSSFVEASLSFTYTGDNPAPFAFDDVLDAALSTAYQSNVVTISGITVGTANISLSAAPGTASYRINGGSWVTAAGTLSNGDTLQLQVTSASSPNTTRSASVNIGGVYGGFSVVTERQLSNPVYFPSDAGAFYTWDDLADVFGPQDPYNYTGPQVPDRFIDLKDYGRGGTWVKDTAPNSGMPAVGAFILFPTDFLNRAGYAQYSPIPAKWPVAAYPNSSVLELNALDYVRGAKCEFKWDIAAVAGYSTPSSSQLDPGNYNVSNQKLTLTLNGGSYYFDVEAWATVTLNIRVVGTGQIISLPFSVRMMIVGTA